MVSTDRLFGANSSLAIKAPCKAATTANITLSGEQTIDGVSIVSGDRVLVKDQTTASQNGIYIADTATWDRSPDFDGSSDVVQGTQIFVNSGSTYTNTHWRLTTSGTITIGTTSLAFSRTLIDDLDAISFIQLGTGATTRPVLDKIREAFSVSDFGAVGDGSTDDSTAFTNASATNKLVYVPNMGGTYKVTGTITGRFFSDTDITISGGTINGLLEIFQGSPTSGPGGNAFDGGIVTHRPHGNYQVSAYQCHTTPNTLPEWGPISEFVACRTADQATNLQRISLTAMADWAGPALSDAAEDFRLQQEASGTKNILDLKIVSQKNSTGWLLEYLDFLAGGSIQAFRRTDSPAPTGNSLEFILKQEKRATTNVLTAAGTQDSPSLRWSGVSYDTSLHSADWKMFVNMTSNAGGSKLKLQTRVDAASYASLIDIADSGTIGLFGSLSLGANDIGSGSNLVYAAVNSGAFASSVPADTALMRVADKAAGAASWKAKGENGFEGWLMLLNSVQAKGADATGTNVFSTTANPLGANTGFLVTESPTGTTIYVPYWTNVAP